MSTAHEPLEPTPALSATPDGAVLLFEQFAQRLAGQFQTASPATVEDGLGSSEARQAEKPASRKAPASSILIVGLKGAQPQEITRQFGARAELRFMGADANRPQLKALAGQVDVVIGVTDFMSHSVDDICSKRAKRYIRCAGGMTRLKQCIDRALSAEEAHPSVAA